MQRGQWPVYTEITRQERAERASEELLERQEQQWESEEEIRKFQRQNDKFIGREPKVRNVQIYRYKQKDGPKIA